MLYTIKIEDHSPKPAIKKQGQVLTIEIDLKARGENNSESASINTKILSPSGIEYASTNPQDVTLSKTYKSFKSTIRVPSSISPTNIVIKVELKVNGSTVDTYGNYNIAIEND
ncbi:hypothetical protein [Saccharicrinis aurantiacus]|uniref:hypothetical protein n=1 Tax=Saccharicrinis aurantiacus TaxID=1849719 RepID=UPI00094F83B8|nr:hypothetical protein [Saccharicrinis aurantiacus]